MNDYVTDYVRHAGLIVRYHAWPSIQTQTVGEHSWQVALIYQQLFGELSSQVERYIRLHDVAELKVGDIPFPVKSLNPELKKAFDAVESDALLEMGIEIPYLEPVERDRVKVCDLLEMMCFGLTDRELGSLLAIPIIRRTRLAATKLAHKNLTPTEFDTVCEFIDKRMKRHMDVLNQERKDT